MKPHTESTANKQLAIYMGAVLQEDGITFKADRDSCPIAHLLDNARLDDLQFKTSWDWLIPVLQKISHIDDITQAGVTGILIKYDFQIDPVWNATAKHICLPYS